MGNVDRDPLRRAAERAVDDHFFVAAALASYRTLTGFDEARLAAWLGGKVDRLPRLALCRWPDGGDGFGAAVQRIAVYAGVDAGRLATLLRAAENAAAMRTEPGGALLAAYDREPAHRDEARAADAPAPRGTPSGHATPARLAADEQAAQPRAEPPRPGDVPGRPEGGR